MVQHDAADRLIAEGNRAEDGGRLAEACASYREAVRAAPGYAKAHLNLGIGLQAQGRLDEAAASYEAALALDAENPYAHYNFGKLLFTRGALERAERHLQATLERRPAFAEARVVLSSVLEAQGRLEAAAACLEPALAQRPELAGAWYNYALLLVKLDLLMEAEAAARRVLGLDPGFLPAYRFLGDLLRNDARHEEAAEIFGAARSRAGGGLEYEQAELHALNHSDRISEEALIARHVQVGARLEAAYPARFAPFANSRDPERLLRIAYLSPDFRQHPVAWFMIPVLEKHDRSRFEAHCYASVRRPDAMTERVRSLAHRWHDVARASHGEIADAIHGDGIDILVDLLGHCADSHLAVFAQRPAPVQATWLGYLNTTGLTRVQYRLSDPCCDPPGDAERLHTETLVRLPHSQWCYRPVMPVEHAATVPCMRNGFVTFGSFNHALKHSPTVRALWASLLAQLPGSRLIVLGVPPGPARDRLLREFKDAGISATRLAIVPPLPLEEYFGWFDAVDLALDSTPYSGGTTTCDTLWMGVPVVTLAGSRPASRSAASILSTLGLTEWIARTPQDYVGLALRFARDPATLAALRRTLREKMRASPLMDESGFVRHLEDAYRHMWRVWCEAAR
jgi:protein O-GlcNAc transferase